MTEDFTTAVLGKTGLKVHRLGLSGTYRPGKEAIYKALDEGINFFFCYGFDGQLIKTLRELGKTRRESFVVATGSYNLMSYHPNVRRTVEKRLRQLGSDYIDIFLHLSVNKPDHFPEKLRDEFYRLREEGKIRAMGISGHNRKLTGSLLGAGALDAAMVRYNAAHRGAENDIFPHLAQHDPGVISYTATRWGYLIRRQKRWPKDRPIPTAGMCYRFVLSNPNVDICLTAPWNLKQLKENIESVRKGPLESDEMALIKEYGDLIHNLKKPFM